MTAPVNGSPGWARSRPRPDRSTVCAPTRCPPRQGIRPATFVAVRVGLVILPSDRWREARRQWEWADVRGFATAWTYDHMRWGGMPDGPWHAAVPVLAAAAGGHDAHAARHAGGHAQLPPPGDAGPRRHGARRPERGAPRPRRRAREARVPTPGPGPGAVDARRADGALRRVPRGPAPDPRRGRDDADHRAHRRTTRRRGAEHAGQRAGPASRSPWPPAAPRACVWPPPTASSG